MIGQTKKPSLLYLSDINDPKFEQRRKTIDIVCIGDSITGWNNIRLENLTPPTGPFTTYPYFLQEKLLDLKVADYGIAGEYSRNGLMHTKKCLELFPNSKYFIIGFGTNDLGERFSPNLLELTSQRIITNLNQMVNEALIREKQPILINIPNLGKLEFTEEIMQITRKQRIYHNQKLKEYCDKRNIPLADICSVLKDEHFADGLHPNEQGAKLIAGEVYKLIKQEN